MTESEAKLKELKMIHEGDAWHGPALREVLAGVNVAQAGARIWELVLHITGWENVFMLRLEGHPASTPTQGDFPPVEDGNEEAWQETVSRLEHSHTQLMSTVASLNDSELNENIAGKDYTKRFLLDGVIRHHVYHTGQIALLKKAFTK